MIDRSNYFSESLLLLPDNVLDGMSENSENPATENLDTIPESSNFEYISFYYKYIIILIIFFWK